MQICNFKMERSERSILVLFQAYLKLIKNISISTRPEYFNLVKFSSAKLYHNFLYLEYFRSKFTKKNSFLDNFLRSKSLFARSRVKPIEFADSVANSERIKCTPYRVQKNAEERRIEIRELMRGGRRVAVWSVC